MNHDDGRTMGQILREMYPPDQVRRMQNRIAINVGYWIDQRVLKPSAGRTKAGDHYRYDGAAADRFRLLVRLNEHGLTRADCGRLVMLGRLSPDGRRLTIEIEP